MRQQQRCRGVRPLLCLDGHVDEIGLPAKSGVSGVVISVVPNVMGVATFSPRSDSFGNSVRCGPCSDFKTQER